MQAEILLETIKNDRTHGSTELALIAIEGISAVVSSSEVSELDKLKDQAGMLMVRLQKSRPSMAALDNLLGRLRKCVSEAEVETSEAFRQKVVDECAEVLRFARDAQLQTALSMFELIDAGDVIMTHSVSSTLKRVFLQVSLQESMAEVRIVVTESRPGDEGKLLAGYLAALGMKTTYITEAQIDLFMPEVDKVLVGADSVLADGSFVNKCGTSLMAMSARYHSVPVYVCAESFKQRADTDFELEQMSPAELKLELAGVKISNIYFEKIPPDLITRWINR